MTAKQKQKREIEELQLRVGEQSVLIQYQEQHIRELKTEIERLRSMGQRDIREPDEPQQILDEWINGAKGES